MEAIRLRKPFFVVNPKAYLFGDALLALARKADELSCTYDLDCLFTAQLVDLPRVAASCPRLIACAQFMEGLHPGRGMGAVLPEALAAAGIRATFLNHAERPSTIHELGACVERAREVGILSVVCADSVCEGNMLAALEPDVMVCELTSLIGGGRVAGRDYVEASTRAVKQRSPNTLVLQAAGISSADDVYRAIEYGADGTGGTSGIVGAPDPSSRLEEMFAALDAARTDFCRKE